jgi:hypothetical protein
MILGLPLILVAIALLGIDCWNWFNTGVFAPISLATIWQAAGLNEPVFESGTVQSIAMYVFHLPLSLLFGLGGFLLTRQWRSIG